MGFRAKCSGVFTCGKVNVSTWILLVFIRFNSCSTCTMGEDIVLGTWYRVGFMVNVVDLAGLLDYEGRCLVTSL